jgi:ssDNA-binding Zn-finger/Zn-ribbon topoisomerase 1
MAAIRDFFGSNCPDCRTDILQAAPSENRMPGEEKAWCPACDHRFTAEQLATQAKGGILKRLFGGRPRHA